MKFSFAVDKALASRILNLAGPVVIAMLSQTLINQVDHVLIGRLPENQSVPGQAALGPALVLLWLVGGSLSALSVGTQALTARRTGAQEPERAGRVLFNSLVVAIIASSIATIAGWYGAPLIFPYILKDPKVVGLGVPYLQWRLVGVVAMVVTVSYKSWFDGLGRTRVHMAAAIAMNIINFVLNVALIFGKWGFPAMGVTGSAIASMISAYIGLLLMIVWSFRGQYRSLYKHYRASNWDVAQQWELVKLSVPSGIATIFVMGGFGFFYKIVGGLDDAATNGPIYAAATQNTIVILMFFFTACMAYGSATATLVGQSMGAKDFDSAERYAWEAVKIGLYVALALGLLIAIAPEQVLRVYTKDALVIMAAAPILRICGLLLPFILAAIVFTQALFGAGNTKFVMFVEFVLHFFCLVPLAYICGVKLGWGMMGVWMGAYVYILLLCAIMGWKFAEGRWKEIKI
jgi:MATE family multidrug resistance protein